jgi:transposase-like protein
MADKRSKYKKKYAKQLLDGARKNGESIEELCQMWGVTRPTYYAWLQKYPEFRAAAEHGERDVIAYWNKLHRMVSQGQIKGNASCINFAMKNVQGINWADRVEVDNKQEQRINRIEVEVIQPKRLEYAADDDCLEQLDDITDAVYVNIDE